MNEQDKQVEQLLGRVRFRTKMDRDEAILRDASATLTNHIAESGRAGSVASAQSTAEGGRARWSLSQIVRRAAIVLLPLVFVLGILAYLRQPTLTLADVGKEFQKQSWVHVKYDNGREEWSNLTDGRDWFKDHDGRAVYSEPNGLRLGWWPQTTYISKDQWFVGNKPPPRDVETAWQKYVQSYGVPSGTKESGMQQHEDTLDGKKVVRFDAHFKDQLGRDILVKQIWADPGTKLPIKVRDVLNLADRNDQKRDAIVGTFSFPTTGPSDIYALGVPKNFPIVDVEAKPADDTAAILTAAKAASAKFPKHWRIVRWGLGSNSGEADLEYRDEVNHAFSRWFTNDADGYAKFPFATKDPQAVLSWMNTRNPIEQHISTTEKDYSRRNPSPGLSNNIPKSITRVTSHTDWGDDINFPPGMQWSYSKWSPPAKKIEAPAGAPAGLIVLRREVGDKRTDYWIDPAKDYACVRAIDQRPVNGNWKNERIDSLSDWIHLPTGDWFAATKSFESFGVFPELRDKAYVETWHSDFTLLKPNEAPADVFNGEKLLKDATLESY